MEMFFLEQDFNFGNLDEIDLFEECSKSDKKSFVIMDGNYLLVFVKRLEKLNLLSVNYYVQIKMKKLRKGCRNAPYKRLLKIGNFADLTLTQAREKTKKIIERTRESGRLHYRKSSNDSTWLFRDDGTKVLFFGKPSFLSFSDVTQEAIYSLQCPPSKGEVSVTIGPHLFVVVRNTLTGTSRQYMYRYTCGNMPRAFRLADAASISLEDAQGMAREVTRRFASVPRSQRNDGLGRDAADSYLCRRAVSRRPLPAANCNRVILSEGAVRQILCNVCPGGFCTSSGEVSLGKVVDRWVACWEKNITKTYRDRSLSFFRSYLGDFWDSGLQSLVERRVLKDLVMALGAVDGKKARRLFSMLCMVLDYAVAIDVIEFNSLHSLGRFLRRPTPEFMPSLDPLHLETDIKALFANHVVRMSPYHRVFFELLLYTLLRPGELAKTRTAWVDFGEGRIYTRSNKTLKEFIVPLAPYGRKLLELLGGMVPPGEFLFPAVRGKGLKHLDTGNVSRDLRRAGCDYFCLHGCRSVGGSFFAQEIQTVPYEVGMACLQHNYTSVAHSRYDRTFMLHPREGAMAHWSAFLEDAIGRWSILRPAML